MKRRGLDITSSKCNSPESTAHIEFSRRVDCVEQVGIPVLFLVQKTKSYILRHCTDSCGARKKDPNRCDQHEYQFLPRRHTMTCSHVPIARPLPREEKNPPGRRRSNP